MRSHFLAPKGRNTIARGNAPGPCFSVNQALKGRNNGWLQIILFRPFRALFFFSPLPGALPLAIVFCPVGAFKTTIQFKILHLDKHTLMDQYTLMVQYTLISSLFLGLNIITYGLGLKMTKINYSQLGVSI